MEKSIENYTNALIAAKKLPTHVDGDLQKPYKFFSKENKQGFIVSYDEEVTPVSVFESAKNRVGMITRKGATRFYIKVVKTYREDGTIKKASEWEKKLMFHKAWSRKDVEITEVTFDVLGVKRETSKLPAGVLIANINFK